MTKVINGTRRPSQDFQVRAAIALATPIENLFPKPAEAVGMTPGTLHVPQEVHS